MRESVCMRYSYILGVMIGQVMRIQMAPSRRGGDRSNGGGGSTYVIPRFLLVPVTQT